MAKKSVTPRKPKPATLEIIPEGAPQPSKTSTKAGKTATAGKTAAEKKPKAAAKPRKAKVKIKSEAGELVDVQLPVGAPFQHSGDDPIGDVTDGEAHISGDDLPEAQSDSSTEMTAYRAETAESAVDGTLVNQPESESASDEAEAEESAEDEPAEDDSAEDSAAPEPREPAKLDRLQKILSQAGIASRRRAEELITEGRVQVNGQVVTQLGAKADAARDHIRVDGKLISEAERHRYFVLNKPKGFVTTVSDPEGRPTVMEFFSKMRERLYPVGRLDYQSEGLLLVTNDGELANQLTRAASGVEKTYLVKVAGQPTEEQLDILRSGVAIDREQPGSGKVHTAPAQIRQVRRGDNPWFEVVLIEGRNRELRKMFSAIDHFVEKIRRVGYGPLVLDLEPGKLRELEPEELAALRLAAEGKWKPRRQKAALTLPKEAGRPSGQRTFRPPARGTPPFRDESPRRKPFAPREQGIQRHEGSEHGKPDFKPRQQRFGTQPDRRPDTRSDTRPDTRSGRPFAAKSGFGRPQGDRPPGKPRFDRDNANARPERSFENRGSGFRPQQREGRPRFGDNPRPARTQSDRPQSGRPRPDRPQGSDRPYFKRPGFQRTEDRPRRFDKPAGKSFTKPRGGEFASRPPARFDRPADKNFSKPRSGEFTPRPPARSFENKPPRGLEIEPVHGIEKPAGRSWSKPTGKTPNKSWTPRHASGRSQDKPGRPPRSEGAPPAFRGKAGPRPGGQSRPAFGGRSRPSFGSKSGPRSGPNAGSRSGPRSSSTSGNRPGFQSGAKPNFKRSGPPRSGGNRPGGRKRG